MRLIATDESRCELRFQIVALIAAYVSDLQSTASNLRSLSVSIENLGGDEKRELGFSARNTSVAVSCDVAQ